MWRKFNLAKSLSISDSYPIWSNASFDPHKLEMVGRDDSLSSRYCVSTYIEFFNTPGSVIAPRGTAVNCIVGNLHSSMIDSVSFAVTFSPPLLYHAYRGRSRFNQPSA